MDRNRLIQVFYWLLGAGSVANGLWMLASPAGWFAGIPAGVPDTGPPNAHFIHDLGVVFTIVGFASAWCGSNLQRCGPVHWIVAAFYGGHALVHVAEILTGALPADHWWIDLPLTFLPALALAWISWLAPWRPQAGAAPAR